jgi:hypothetical protein
MIKHFKTFFYPDTSIYTYNQSKEVVITKIAEVLKRKVTFLSSNDMKGRFLNGDTFAIVQ